MSQTKNNHLVPVVYLKQFTNEKGMLVGYDKTLNRPTSYKDPEQICYSLFAYADYQGVEDATCHNIEKLLKLTEDDYPFAMGRLLGNSTKYTEKDQYTLSLMLAGLFMRTSARRRHLKEGGVEFYSRVAEQRKSYIEKTLGATDARKVNILIENEVDTYSKSSFCANVWFSQLFNIASIFMIKKWRINFFESDMTLLTSDNPMMDALPSSKKSMTSIYKPSLFDIIQQVPLTPHCLLELYPPECEIESKILRISEDYSHVVQELNECIVNNAERFVYSSHEKYLSKAIESYSVSS